MDTNKVPPTNPPPVVVKEFTKDRKGYIYKLANLITNQDPSAAVYDKLMQKNSYNCIEIISGVFSAISAEGTKISYLVGTKAVFTMILDRTPTDEETNYWANEMNVTKKMESVVIPRMVKESNGAAHKICQSFGLNMYHLQEFDYAKYSNDRLGYIHKMFNVLKEKDATPEEIGLVGGGNDCLYVVGDYLNKVGWISYDDNDFIKKLYRATQEKEPTEADVAYWSDQKKKNQLKLYVFMANKNAKNFSEAVCKKYGLGIQSLQPNAPILPDDGWGGISIGF